MFARAYNMITRKENFANPLSAATDPISNGAQAIATYFSKTLPKPILVSDTSLDISALTTTPVGGKYTSLPNTRLARGISGTALADNNSQCASTGSGDAFDHLVSLAKSQDPNSKLRCGWLYNTQNPNNSMGAYGSESGPFKTDTTGTWMWNLQNAQEKQHTAICSNMKSCSDMDSSLYKGRCAWCSSSGKAVPILNGQVAYNYNPNLACSADNLVTSSAACARPHMAVVVNEAGEPVLQAPAGADACTPLPSGALPRDCLIQKVISAGCNEQGTLVQALRGGSDTNYVSNLLNDRAYKEYQERAVISMDQTSIQYGKLTTAQALDEFKRVNDHALSSQQGALEFASRDLCFKKGVIDTFDFCTELKDSTPGPYTLDCLRKAFLQAGGQHTGTKCPSKTTLKFWNSQATWLDVKKEIATLAARAQSSDRRIQERAAMEFYGIKLEEKLLKEVYQIGQYNTKQSDAEAKCRSHNGTLASYAQLSEAQINGADWCSTGWVSDKDRPQYPITTSTGQGCGNGSTGIMEYLPPSNMAAVNCYGVKPVQGAHNILPFNQSTFYGPPTSAPPPYRNRGCWKDSGNRALPIRLGNVKSVNECYQLANQKGLRNFGIQYKGECWAGNNSNWNRYGNVDLASCLPLGTAWTNIVNSVNKPFTFPSFRPNGNVVLMDDIEILQDYRLKFDITPYAVGAPNYSALMQFSIDKNLGLWQFGRRSPCLWFVPGTTQLHVRIGDKNDTNWGENIGGCQIRKKSHFVLECKGSDVTIKLDDIVLRLKQPSKRYSGSGVVLAGNSYYPNADAVIENMTYEHI